MPEKTRILIVDDHNVVRQGLRVLLGDCTDMVVVGEASDGNIALEKARNLRPDVILMDIRMPVCDGLEATANIRKHVPEAKIIVLTVEGDRADLVYQSIRAGAVGYIPKISDVEEVIRAIRLVARGEAFVASPSLTSLVSFIVSGPDQSRPPEKTVPADTLTLREREVLDLVAQGDSNRTIAEKLSVSESTIRSHLHHILDKLRLTNRVQAAAFALRTARPESDGFANGRLRAESSRYRDLTSNPEP
jgi:DNA-binding NarL/FixJ family response regulator